MPSHLKRALWRLSGICMPNLSNRIVASRCGPMKPRGVAWNGAGGWLISSQSRQVNFSRTVSITLKRRGISSSVSVTSSPSFASREPPQQAQIVGASITTRSRSMSSGQGLRTGRLRVKARTFCAFAAAACAASSSSLAAVTSSSSCNSSWSISRAVRSERWPVQFALELLDPQFQMRDQRLGVGQLRLRIGGLRHRRCRLSASLAFSRASRSASSAAWALARSDGRSSGFDVMKPLNQIFRQIQSQNAIQPALDARFPEGCASRSRTTDKTAAPARS